MNSDFYVILPSNLIFDEKYSNLSAKAIVLYSLFLNRRKLSLRNKGHQDCDGTFIYYSTQQISEHLHCGRTSAKSALNELEKAGLVKIKFQEFGLPLKIYVNDIRAGDGGTSAIASEIPQDKPFKNTYNNSNYNRKPHKSTPVQQEKQVSFDVEKAEEKANDGTLDFGEMKIKKRRTRNVGPTIRK